MAYPISDVPRRIVYSGSAGVGPYAFTFEVLAATDIAVYKNGTLLTLTTDYTVSINTGTGTGTVTLVVAATGSDQITLVGDRAIERTSDFVTGGDLFANTLNTELDSLTIFAQQVDEKADRAIKVPVTDPTTINMTLPAQATRANKILGFNASGNPTQTSNTLVAIDAATTAINEIAAAPSGNAAGISFLQAGSGAVVRTAQSKMRDVVSVKDFGAVDSAAFDNTAAFTAALAAADHVIVPPGTYGLNGMVEILGRKTVELMGGALIQRSSSMTANTDPLFWLKGTAAVLIGAGKISSGIQTQNRAPKGIVRIGHKDMTESHDNVTYCTLANLGIYGAVDYGQTTGDPDVCVYMPNPELGSPVKASYFHTVHGLRVSSANIGIWLQGAANANTIYDITGQELGNTTLGGSMLALNGGSDNRISNFFFHLSPDTTFIDITDQGGFISSMNSLSNMVCEQGGSGRWLRANAGCNATSNYIQGQDNTLGGSDLSSAFIASNIIIPREDIYAPSVRVANAAGLYLAGVPIGEWVAAPYIAGNFTGSGSMTWTVDSGDVQQFAYCIVGKTMTVAFGIVTSSVGGTPSANLLLTIPASKTPKKGFIRGAVVALDNGVAAQATILTLVGDSQLVIQKVDVSNWTASTNNTAVYGQISFEIN